MESSKGVLQDLLCWHFHLRAEPHNFAELPKEGPVCELWAKFVPGWVEGFREVLNERTQLVELAPKHVLKTHSPEEAQHLFTEEDVFERNGGDCPFEEIGSGLASLQSELAPTCGQIEEASSGIITLR